MSTVAKLRVQGEMTLTSSLVQKRSKFRPTTTQRYIRAGYRLLGTHSGIQICRWTRAALMGRRFCYKRWYGIRSHRCLQLTPALQFCNLRCVFCWRFHTFDRFRAEPVWDPPNLILDEAVAAQRKLLVGFKANPFVIEKLFEESMRPTIAGTTCGRRMMHAIVVSMQQEMYTDARCVSVVI